MTEKRSLSNEQAYQVLEDFMEKFPTLLDSKEFQESFKKQMREENFSFGLPVSYLSDDGKTIIREYQDGHKEYIAVKR